jgi:protein-disulfide isomerase
MKKIIVFLFLISSLALAQVGQPASGLLEQLSTYKIQKLISGYVADGRFTFNLEERGGLVYKITGQGLLDDNNISFSSDLIAAGTGYGANIAVPVKQFLAERIGELADKGDTPLAVEQYTLNVNVTGSKPYKLVMSLSLAEIPTEAFPVGKYALGTADATYVIREFSDFQCPYCARFVEGPYKDIKDQLLSRGDVRFEFHHFPLVSIHPNAQPAAEAMECVVAANTVESFWAYHDALFARQQAWQGLPDASSYFVRLAQDSGLKTDGVEDCIKDRSYAQDVVSAYEAGVKLGIGGTPTVFVNGFKVGDYTQAANYVALIELIEKFSNEQ